MKGFTGLAVGLRRVLSLNVIIEVVILLLQDNVGRTLALLAMLLDLI
jgi:hypothetical protein